MNDALNRSKCTRCPSTGEVTAFASDRNLADPPDEEIHRHLGELIAQTCQHPPGSLQRRQSFNRLILAILKSGCLWKENVPYYEEALQQTWVYLYRNLCEANTAEKYDPSRSRVTTWLNSYLRRRLQDLRLKQEEEQRKPRQFPKKILETGEVLDPIDTLEAPADIEQTLLMLEDIKTWIETDADGELRQRHIKGRSDLTCQLLMLRRLPPETTWEALEAELNCRFSTLANFYQRQCLPRLRKFAEDRGYL